jgi:squalene-associated FAD-dependent desaturase
VNTDNKRHIAIVGGGYAGMAVAATLASANIRVTVFESARQLGGRARGVIYNDTQLDNGQHILLGCYRQTLRLIEQVGGNPERDLLRLPLRLTLHNHLEFKAAHLPAPLHLVVGLLSAKGLSLRERLSVARFYMAMASMKFKLSTSMSAYELLDSHKQGGRLARLLWEPLCVAALNTPLGIASAQVFLNVLRESFGGSRSASDMLLSRMDLTALFPDRAAAYIKQRGGEVVYACEVRAVLPQDEGIALMISQDSLPAVQTRSFSHAVCATSPTNAARLLSNLPQLKDVAEQIAAIPHQPVYTVYIQYPECVSLPLPMLGLDRCYSQWLFDKGRISGQRGLVAVVISAQGRHQDCGHELLAQNVIQELREQLHIKADPIWYKVIAEKRATFSCEAGLLRPENETPLANVMLAGDYTNGDYPATLEGAVTSGILCARSIIDRW